MTPQQLRAQALAAEKAIPLPGTPDEVCAQADTALRELVDIMNEETTLLRRGKLDEAGEVAAKKAEVAQTYVGLARAIQANVEDLRESAPQLLEKLQNGHAALATQMAENLRVLATAKALSEDILNSVASHMGQTGQTAAYGATGQGAPAAAENMKGVSVNATL